MHEHLLPRAITRKYSLQFTLSAVAKILQVPLHHHVFAAIGFPLTVYIEGYKAAKRELVKVFFSNIGLVPRIQLLNPLSYLVRVCIMNRLEMGLAIWCANRYSCQYKLLLASFFSHC